MIERDIPKFALARAKLDGREVVGEVVDADRETVTIREFGAGEHRVVSRDAVEVK